MLGNSAFTFAMVEFSAVAPKLDEMVEEARYLVRDKRGYCCDPTENTRISGLVSIDNQVAAKAYLIQC